jgi:hypothetical protein
MATLSGRLGRLARAGRDAVWATAKGRIETVRRRSVQLNDVPSHLATGDTAGAVDVVSCSDWIDTGGITAAELARSP